MFDWGMHALMEATQGTFNEYYIAALRIEFGGQTTHASKIQMVRHRRASGPTGC